MSPVDATVDVMTSLTPARSVSSFGSVVVSPHDVATTSGLEILAAGGNAVDAAIATNAVQGTVAPETCGVGGDLFALVYGPGMSRPAFLNASGRAGSGASAETLRSEGHSTMPLFHPAAVTVPGCVDGWIALHNEYGRLPFARLIEPAIRLARDGFPASAELAASFTRRSTELAGHPSAAAMYPGGEMPTPGARITRADLAATLTEIATGERAAFYEGRFGRALLEASEARIRPGDLARVQANWDEPLSKDVFGLTAWTSPPNTQGYLTLATTRTFELSGGPNDPADPDFWHVLIEAYRAAAFERDYVLADPAGATISGDELIADERLSDRARRLDRRRAGVWGAHDAASGGTAYMCAIDADGLAISLIQSNFHGLGAGIGAGDTGVLLHNRGGGFNLRAGHPNELVPGRRPLHTLSPTMWTDGGDIRLILGTRGGHQQPQLLATVASLHLHAGLSPADAQAYPRWTTEHLQGDRSQVTVEGRTATSTIDELRARGHSIDVGPDWPGANGPISMIAVDPSGLRTRRRGSARCNHERSHSMTTRKDVTYLIVRHGEAEGNRVHRFIGQLDVALVRPWSPSSRTGVGAAGRAGRVADPHE